MRFSQSNTDMWTYLLFVVSQLQTLLIFDLWFRLFATELAVEKSNSWFCNHNNRVWENGGKKTLKTWTLNKFCSSIWLRRSSIYSSRIYLRALFSLWNGWKIDHSLIRIKITENKNQKPCGDFKRTLIAMMSSLEMERKSDWRKTTKFVQNVQNARKTQLRRKPMKKMVETPKTHMKKTDHKMCG